VGEGQSGVVWRIEAKALRRAEHPGLLGCLQQRQDERQHGWVPMPEQHRFMGRHRGHRRTLLRVEVFAQAVLARGQRLCARLVGDLDQIERAQVPVQRGTVSRLPSLYSRRGLNRY
jgi:hypothetical protein